MNTFAKLTAAASIALLSTGAYAASHAMKLDADDDGMLTEAEFEAASDMGFVFAAVDSNGDGMISEAEYNEAARDMADEDDNGSLDDIEFERYDELARMFDAT